MFRYIMWSFVLIQVLISGSCSLESGKGVSVMNWNVQTFFDGVFDGNEYRDFRDSSHGWNTDKYAVRLKRLAGVIRKLDCDIVVLEELEKETQLYDISNALASDFNSARNWSYGFFAKEKDASIGTGIISRLEICEATVHGIRKAGLKQPSLRPVIKCVLKKDDAEFVLFANHWKSKSGDSESSAFWRRRQERLLADLIAEENEKSGRPVICCGDFNMDVLEFKRNPECPGQIVLQGKKNIPLYSPWFDSDGKLIDGGSYWFRGEWSRIDNFFVSSRSMAVDFCACSEGEWTEENRQPRKYKIYSGDGFSDHLPVTCTLNLR